MMDRALKERVIGAAVLVAAVVLLVPVFLDGPANDSAEVRESITLPGQDENAAKQKTIVLDRDRSQPVPAAAVEQTPVAESPPPQEKPTPQKPAEKEPDPAPAKEQSAAAASSTGMFAVQLGSFSSQENAERLASSLRKAGYAAFLSQTKSGSSAMHRVRVGPQKDRAAAEAVAAKLAAAGHKGQVVPHP